MPRQQPQDQRRQREQLVDRAREMVDRFSDRLMPPTEAARLRRVLDAIDQIDRNTTGARK